MSSRIEDAFKSGDGSQASRMNRILLAHPNREWTIADLGAMMPGVKATAISGHFQRLAGEGRSEKSAGGTSCLGWFRSEQENSQEGFKLRKAVQKFEITAASSGCYFNKVAIIEIELNLRCSCLNRLK